MAMVAALMPMTMRSPANAENQRRSDADVPVSVLAAIAAGRRAPKGSTTVPRHPRAVRLRESRGSNMEKTVGDWRTATPTQHASGEARSRATATHTACEAAVTGSKLYETPAPAVPSVAEEDEDESTQIAPAPPAVARSTAA
jgi:hypothetical protein